MQPSGIHGYQHIRRRCLSFHLHTFDQFISTGIYYIYLNTGFTFKVFIYRQVEETIRRSRDMIGCLMKEGYIKAAPD